MTSVSPLSMRFAHAGGGTDVASLINSFRRRLKVFLGVLTLVFAGVLIFTLQAIPRYEANARVLIDPRTRDVVQTQAVLSGLPADDVGVVDTEVEVLRSRSLAERVVKQLNLERDPEFSGSEKATGIAGLVTSVAPRQSAPAASETQLEKTVDAVLSQLNVRRAATTYLIDVGFESTKPEKAARIANAFATNYINLQREAKYDANAQASGFLTERMATLADEVQAAEAAVQQYKIANNLLSSQGATLTEQEISSLNSQIASAQSQQAEAQARANTARRQMARGSNGGDVGEALNSPVVQALRTQRAEMSRKVADLETSMGERNPALITARRQLADIDQQIAEEISRTINNLDAQADVARQRTASLLASAGRTRGTLASTNRATVQLGELQRKADSVRALYETYLNRSKETSSQQGMEQADARIVSVARTPTEASYPDKKLNLAFGLILGLAAGMAMVLLLELLDTRLSTAEDVERQLDVLALPSVPLLASTLDDAKSRRSRKAPPWEFVVERPLSSFTESFRNLKASLALPSGGGGKIIAMTSALPGEGKTTAAICLARVIAMGGAKVVVVDCDLRHRSLNRFVENTAVTGLLDVLSGAVPLDQALILDEETGAAVLPLANAATTARDVFSSDEMRNLLEELRRRFEFVVLDTAPVLPLVDARILASMADVVVVLTRWRKTPRKAVETTLGILHAAGANIAGVALTQVDLRQQTKHGYGDPGYYYKAYKGYYS